MKKKDKEIKEIEVVENEAVEVFGTKEVSVKEFMGSTDKSLMILENYDLSKENLIALKVKHEARVDELVLIEKLSPAELKELSSIRGELREPRYLVQKIESNNVSVFESYKKMDKANLKTLIDINKELEVKADDKIKLEEERKKKEKEDEANAEALRIKTITDKIDEVETSCYEIIQKMTFSEIEFSKTQLFAFFTVEFDFEEYDILFEQTLARIETAIKDKIDDLNEREEQRLENERMKQDIFNVRVIRFKELGFELEDDIMFRSTELPHTYTKSELLNIDSATFERAIENIKKAKEDLKQAKLDAENLERENKAKADKEKIFEIRKCRLAEIGFVLGPICFESGFEEVRIVKEYVFHKDTIEFEELFFSAKLAIEKAKSNVKKEIAEKRKLSFEEAGLIIEDETQIYFPKTNLYVTLEALYNEISESRFEAFLAEFIDCQKEKDFELSKADAERLKKENKARIKKYAADKKTLIEFVKSLDVRNPIPELDNVESEETLSTFMIALEDFRKEWINNVEII